MGETPCHHCRDFTSSLLSRGFCCRGLGKKAIARRERGGGLAYILKFLGGLWCVSSYVFKE